MIKIKIINKPVKFNQKEYIKEYHQEHKEEISAYKKEYRQKNKGQSNKEPVVIDNMCIRLKELPTKHARADKKKGLYDKVNHIDRVWVVDTINKQSFECHYCKDLMMLDCGNKEPKLLTIERVNPLIGHIKSNCVFACFECNLLTRYMTHDKLFEYIAVRTKEEGKRTCNMCFNHFEMNNFKQGNTHRMNCKNCYNKERRERYVKKN